MNPVYLILTRHGETLENRQHLMQGHMPGKLSPEGIRQAHHLAELLREEEIEVVVCSDLARSYDTAIIIAHHLGLEPQPTFLLREIDWGPYTGGRLDKIDWAHLPEGCETLVQLYQRAEKFILYLKKQYEGKHVLVVGHGAINRAIIANIEKKAPEDMLEMPIMKNTSFVRLLIV